MTRLPMRLLLVLTAALLLSPAAAFGDTRDRIIKDCADDGRLQGDYSKSELRDARQNMPSDVAEYTDCADVLRRAELPDSGGTGGTDAVAAATGGAVGELLTPADDREREALVRAASAGAQPIDVDGRTVTPGAAGLAPDAKRNGIPDSLIAVLVLLALAAAAMAYPAVRRGGLGRFLRRS